MRILVCGGRDFDDWHVLSTTLEGFDVAPFIIQGGCKRCRLSR